jgi:hypothetical protein
MDESGLSLGRCMNQRVVGGSKSKRSYIKSPKTREWVIIIKVISALGRFLHPIVIFKGKSVQTSWFHHDCTQDWLYITSENGWTFNNIGLSWLKEVFLPKSAPKDLL